MPPVLRRVAILPGLVPLELYGGADGTLPTLLLATGIRLSGNGSRILRPTSAAGTAWVDETVPDGAETIHKIRHAPDRVYAFFETGGPFIVSRPIESTVWSFESVPGPDFVGGRGLCVRANGTVHAGGSAEWNALVRRGEHYAKAPGGGWSKIGEQEPGILWEIEEDGLGRLWEFWHHLTFPEEVGPHTYIDGSEIPSPETNLNHATWFPTTGHMYCGGSQSDSSSPTVKRWTGATWETVFSFAGGSRADHLLAVPRRAGELWATAQNPFQVAMTVDGTTWDVLNVPALSTGDDTNSLTGLGYWQGAVWAAARDDVGGVKTIIFREPARPRGIQVI